jgi:hypothetical protein
MKKEDSQKNTKKKCHENDSQKSHVEFFEAVILAFATIGFIGLINLIF